MGIEDFIDTITVIPWKIWRKLFISSIVHFEHIGRFSFLDKWHHSYLHPSFSLFIFVSFPFFSHIASQPFYLSLLLSLLSPSFLPLLYVKRVPCYILRYYNVFPEVRVPCERRKHRRWTYTDFIVRVVNVCLSVVEWGVEAICWSATSVGHWTQLHSLWKISAMLRNTNMSI
jgi:hypothetical protein